ncbi:hydrolase [Actinoplanes philippinensis]|uniref:Haloacid dehalogenase superfamily, subfamily IA, variant 3 with third motif having DD or ED n=1 Tax=Actinoplanes philippinensis TaxID=35752 RepID=A0A1I2IQD7_9ACTN|nr:HAD-IA family hydrolase [Actinoplanes philippinensis]GIE79050.1 hydrolase [Actinoplanes philippinensis]SFF44622.1 haloacid dehalogenase superfamily, subfamily IA, variant 3 with third motif having DD or ED [Actinoplanes philippinensis]
MTGPTLSDLVGAGPLLLDFDGPVCSIFAGYPAPRVAAKLVALLDIKGIAMTPQVRSETDPLAVLRWVGETCSHRLTAEVEDALCTAELHAARIATPTPFGHEVILGAHARGIPVAVVSNNSAVAIEAYLTAHNLASYVTPIIGRPYADPQSMKPDPRPVLDAVRVLGADPRACVLVGDSLSDIEAAHAAGVAAIGYANRPWKVAAFAAAETVVTSMEAIAEQLSS